MSVLLWAAAVAAGPPEFAVRFDDRAAAWIESGVLEGRGCTLAADRVGGEAALRLTTRSEFCDGLIDLRAVAGGVADFREARWLRVRCRVPAESRVAALKLNFRDAEGNFGGVPEVVNAFAVRPGEWVEAVVDLRTLLRRFEVWHGEASPLPAVTHLSLNPYCADQSRPSSLWVSEIELTVEKPAGDFDAAVCERPGLTGLPLRLDFDDAETLRRMTAWRAFEASGQALRSGVAGNETMAVRLTGLEKNRYIAFLPMLDRLTGRTHDLSGPRRVRFRYYLEPGGDPVDGVRLFVAGEGWESVAVAEDFLTELQPGGWRAVDVDLSALTFTGELSALSEAAEVRLDVKHRGAKGAMEGKRVTVWVDDFEIE